MTSKDSSSSINDSNMAAVEDLLVQEPADENTTLSTNNRNNLITGTTHLVVPSPQQQQSVPYMIYGTQGREYYETSTPPRSHSSCRDGRTTTNKEREEELKWAVFLIEQALKVVNEEEGLGRHL